MDIFITYIVPILELIMSVIGVVFLFKPTDPSVRIDIGDKYYFTQNIDSQNPDNSTNMQNGSDYGPVLIMVVLFFVTYIFYSLAGKLMIFIIMAMSFIKIIKYLRLGINYKPELVSPIISIIAFYALNFLPTNVKEFWETNTKVDIHKFSSLKSMLYAIFAPVPEFVKLVTNFKIDRIRNISIFATITMTLFVVLFEVVPIFQRKEKIRVASKGFIIFYVICLLILLGFAFYHIENNPIRIITEQIIKWFSN